MVSSVNLYRFTYFLDLSFVQFSQICLLRKHSQSLLNGICDTGYSFILNVSHILTAGKSIKKCHGRYADFQGNDRDIKGCLDTFDGCEKNIKTRLKLVGIPFNT